jgi:hypothetical protein
MEGIQLMNILTLVKPKAMGTKVLIFGRYFPTHPKAKRHPKLQNWGKVEPKGNSPFKRGLFQSNDKTKA